MQRKARVSPIKIRSKHPTPFLFQLLWLWGVFWHKNFISFDNSSFSHRTVCEHDHPTQQCEKNSWAGAMHTFPSMIYIIWMLLYSTTRIHALLDVCPGQLEWDLFSALHWLFYFRNWKVYPFLLVSLGALHSLWPVSMVTIRTGLNVELHCTAAVRKKSRQKNFMDISRKAFRS